MHTCVEIDLDKSLKKDYGLEMKTIKAWWRFYMSVFQFFATNVVESVTVRPVVLSCSIISSLETLYKVGWILLISKISKPCIWIL